MTFVLTRAQLEDLPAMIELEAELFGTDAWSPELMVAEVSYPESYYLVAREHGDDRLVGYGGLRAARQDARQGDIQTLAVAPEHRRSGVGRTLLRALLAEASVRGVTEVFLEVRADNEAALLLYSSEGFEAIDRRVGYYQPDGVDAIVMRLQDLNPKPGWAVADE
jgi:N6-L-threonylcarbamoyladenine synthase/ribosomal-protein-alanine N-acetyltransferase